MKKIVVVWMLSLCSTGISAQHVLPIGEDSTHLSGKCNHEFIISGIADYASTSIGNELTKRLLYGGDISEGIKNQSFDNHLFINRLGIDVSGEIEYRKYHSRCFKKRGLGWVMKAGTYNYGSLLYKKDFYGLTFYGNERYLGQTADFTGTRLFGMAFQKFGFGVFNEQTKNALTFNVYSIANYLDASVYKGQLYQSSSGDTLSLALNGNLEYTSAQDWVKGWGAGIDMDIRQVVPLKDRKAAVVRFEIKNLGISIFDKPLTRYYTGAKTQFNGYALNDLFSNEQSAGAKLKILDSLGIDSTSVRRWRFMPSFMQIGKIVSENDASLVQSFFGFRMYGLGAFVPMVYAGIDYKFFRMAHLGLSASFGGFANLRFGLYSNWKFGECTLGIGSENITGLFLKDARGASLTMRLSCLF